MAKVVLSSSNVFVTKVMELRVLTMYRFYLKSIILWNIIILISCNDENDFIRDYFVHRKVAKVVGFSCYDATGECDEKKKKILAPLKLFSIFVAVHILIFSFETDDVKLLRSFNDVNTFVAILRNEYSTKSDEIFTRFLYTDNHYLGIFLDLRCENQNFSRLISRVS